MGEEQAVVEACREGDVSLLRSLLSLHPHLLHAQDPSGRKSSLLHLAAGWSHAGSFRIMRLYGEHHC